MSDEFEKISGLVNSALDEVYAKDLHLIDNSPIFLTEVDGKHYVGERSIVFRFAHYLQNLIDNDGTYASYNLDCEYNRNGVETKNLPQSPNGTFPDVILHKRGSNDHNITVLEFKTHWNKNQADDKRKIREFTDGSGAYHFHSGATILIAKSRDKVKIDWYVDGRKINPVDYHKS